MVDQQLIDRLAAAIDSANIGYSMRQVRLVDGVNTYTLTIDGMPAEDFTDTDFESATDQVYARIREVTQRRQAEAVIAALSVEQAPQPVAVVTQPIGFMDIDGLVALVDEVRSRPTPTEAPPVESQAAEINVDKIAKAIVLAACELDDTPDPDDDDTILITVQDLEAVAHRHITVALERAALAAEGSAE